jgi:hypothetical protein
MNTKFTLKIFTLLTILAVAAPLAWALVDPVVDGELDANEYSTSQLGAYSRCWYRVFNGDFYVFLDWYCPLTNYDPATCPDYAAFTWDSPDDYRLLVRADSTGWLQKKISGVWTTVANDCEQASNYTSTPGHPTAHPVWEIKIPDAKISTGACVEYCAAKNGCDSPDECLWCLYYGSGPWVCY